MKLSKKILSAMLITATFSTTAFAAEVPSKSAAEKDSSFIQGDSLKTRMNALSDKRKLEKQENLEKFNANINEKPEYTFDREMAVKSMVGSVAHSVIHKIIPISLEARYFAPHFNAEVQSDNISYNGGKISLKDQFGIGNTGAPEFIFKYSGLSLDYIHVHGSGDNNLGLNNLRFKGTTFDGNISTKSDFDYFKLNYEQNIVSVLGTGVSWNAGVAAMHWRGKVEGTDVYGFSASKSREYWAPVPMIGIGAHAQIPTMDSLKFHANISGLPLGGFGHFYDLELGVRYFPIENLAITAGYRRIDVHLEHDDDYGNLTLNGPYGGLRFEF